MIVLKKYSKSSFDLWLDQLINLGQKNNMNLKWKSRLI